MLNLTDKTTRIKNIISGALF